MKAIANGAHKKEILLFLSKMRVLGNYVMSKRAHCKTRHCRQANNGVENHDDTWEAYDDKGNVVDCRLTMPNMKDILPIPSCSNLFQPCAKVFRYHKNFVNLDSFCQNLLSYADFMTTIVI